MLVREIHRMHIAKHTDRLQSFNDIEIVAIMWFHYNVIVILNLCAVVVVVVAAYSRQCNLQWVVK